MIGKRRFFATGIVFLAILIFNISTLLAVAFPFREFAQGDPVPDVTLRGYSDANRTVTFSGMKGKPFVAVFWGADLPEKIEHSARVLREIEALTPFLRERNIQLLSVNAQEDDPANIDKVIKLAASRMDVFVDPGRKAYAALGLFVMPTVLLVDANGKVAAGMGYSRDLVDRLKGAVEVMRGEKTAAQVEAELHPEMKETSEQDKAGRRHYDFGMVMLKRGQVDAAIREFDKAVAIDPAMSEAQQELGCLYLEKDELDRASVSIDKAIAADPDLKRARICRGELMRRLGKPEEAARELKGVLAVVPDDFEALYYLARVYEDRKQMKEAAETYRQAYLLIVKYTARER